MTTLDPKAIKAASRKITGGSTFTADERIGIAIDVVRTYLAKSAPALPAQPVAVSLMDLGHEVLDLALPSSKGNSTEQRLAYNSGIVAAANLIKERALAAPSQQEDVTDLDGAQYEAVHRAAIETYEASTPPDQRYSAVALRKAVDAARALEAALVDRVKP